MIPLVAVGIVGVGALWFWHNQQVKAKAQQFTPYLGAPAWPAMTPQIVPQVGLPAGFEQAATYYGVSSSLLEPFTK